MPKLQKKFTDYEKDKFIKETFDTIKKIFIKALKSIESNYGHINCDLDEITKYKFIAKIYLNGQLKNQCKIWVGGLFSNNSISYSEGNINIHQDNSLNDSISVESDFDRIYLKPMGPDFFGQNNIPEKANPKEAAEYFWSKFIQNLSF